MFYIRLSGVGNTLENKGSDVFKMSPLCTQGFTCKYQEFISSLQTDYINYSFYLCCAMSRIAFNLQLKRL